MRESNIPSQSCTRFPSHTTFYTPLKKQLQGRAKARAFTGVRVHRTGQEKAQPKISSFSEPGLAMWGHRALGRIPTFLTSRISICCWDFAEPSGCWRAQKRAAILCRKLALLTRHWVFLEKRSSGFKMQEEEGLVLLFSIEQNSEQGPWPSSRLVLSSFRARSCPKKFHRKSGLATVC